MTTALWIAGPLLVCGGFVYGFFRYLIVGPAEQPVDEVDARMEAAIAAENHAGRRAALILARPNHQEER